MCAYTHRVLGTPTASQHNILTRNKLSQLFLVLLTGFEPRVFGSCVRCSTNLATPPGGDRPYSTSSDQPWLFRWQDCLTDFKPHLHNSDVNWRWIRVWAITDFLFCLGQRIMSLYCIWHNAQLIYPLTKLFQQAFLFDWILGFLINTWRVQAQKPTNAIWDEIKPWLPRLSWKCSESDDQIPPPQTITHHIVH